MPRGLPDSSVIFANAKRDFVLIAIAAKHCKVHRTSIHKWIRKGKVKTEIYCRWVFVRLKDCERCAKGVK